MKYMIAFILGVFTQIVPSEASPWDTRKEHDKDHKYKYSDYKEQKMIL